MIIVCVRKSTLERLFCMKSCIESAALCSLKWPQVRGLLLSSVFCESCLPLWQVICQVENDAFIRDSEAV